LPMRGLNQVVDAGQDSAFSLCMDRHSATASR
jgi:hypothetical protein